MRGSGGYRCTWGRRRGERRGESRERLETKQRRSATLKGRPERQNRRQGPTKRHPLGHRARQQKEGGITTSKLVPDARTTMTRRDLTSEVEWDRVLYSWYGRALLLMCELCTVSNLASKGKQTSKCDIDTSPTMYTTLLCPLCALWLPSVNTLY